ncbi:hypothetical protein EYF80_045397 [Liparis tanakae]|uniref:Uncharacterized protein n=1 Tax=Liparis tanakae TaxID=230148 RepID=A0A4Z2FUQ8_9TELE|nr:hypothetical protein EYF80_045397 [Liparis tanakae]
MDGERQRERERRGEERGNTRFTILELRRSPGGRQQPRGDTCSLAWSPCGQVRRRSATVTTQHMSSRGERRRREREREGRGDRRQLGCRRGRGGQILYILLDKEGRKQEERKGEERRMCGSVTHRVKSISINLCSPE